MKEIEKTEAEAETTPAHCELCVELAEVLSAPLADYEYVVYGLGNGGPIENMLVARTLLNEINDGTNKHSNLP